MVTFDQRSRHRKLKLQGQQLTDLLCVAMFATTFLFLRSLDAGAIYFWMKDLTQEFLKLQVIYTAVEMFDKVRRPTPPMNAAQPTMLRGEACQQCCRSVSRLCDVRIGSLSRVSMPVADHVLLCSGQPGGAVRDLHTVHQQPK